MDFSKLGSTLLSKNGEVSVDSLKDLDYIGLYFSAHWCPPCRGFTPTLEKFYVDLKGSGKPEGKKMEIVFVTCDRNDKQFKDYYNEMSWLAIPFSEEDIRNELSSEHGVQGIPALIFINCKTGKVDKDGRSKVTGSPGEFPWGL